jgi:hypothetical protein
MLFPREERVERRNRQGFPKTPRAGAEVHIGIVVNKIEKVLRLVDVQPPRFADVSEFLEIHGQFQKLGHDRKPPLEKILFTPCNHGAK